MSVKRCIIYLRISTERQSNFSIDGQRNATQQWCERNKVAIVDTFVDEGYSARNFDRPDFMRLNEFIKKHHRTVDYLVINAFDRFSRDAGEAIVAIKKLQRQFAIKVVSVAEGVTFDADDPGSFFYAGLMLLKGEDEIIRNRSRINMGIYTAKKQEGRYLGAAPIGYENARDERGKPIIKPCEATMPIVRYIFAQFLSRVPINEILKGAIAMGFAQKANGAIQRILQNRVYIGQVHVKAYKDAPEEWVTGIHQPIISAVDFYRVQDLLRPKQVHTRLNDAFPLRGVVRCHCGLPLTGSASRGRHGGLFNYYKCNKPGHNNNNSTEKMHQQLDEVWNYMSLPASVVKGIRQESMRLMEEQQKANRQLYRKKASEYDQVMEKLQSVEDKWITNQLTFDSYNRWYTGLNNQRQQLKAKMDELSADENELWSLLKNELDMATDLRYVYNSCDLLSKQQMIKLGFDNRLYYEDKIYRTPFLISIFRYNELILKQKKLLLITEKNEKSCDFSSGGAEGTRTPVQTHLP